MSTIGRIPQKSLGLLPTISLPSVESLDHIFLVGTFSLTCHKFGLRACKQHEKLQANCYCHRQQIGADGNVLTSKNKCKNGEIGLSS